MTKASRLEPLTGLADAREAEAARGLAATLRALEGKRAELARLESYLEDYRRQADEHGAARDGAWWLNVRAFIARLTDAVSLSRREIEQLAAGHRAAVARWESSHKHARMLEKLVDRYCDQETKARERREQTELDERAARTHR